MRTRTLAHANVVVRPNNIAWLKAGPTREGLLADVGTTTSMGYAKDTRLHWMTTRKPNPVDLYRRRPAARHAMMPNAKCSIAT
jgi:hypothetical protein